MPELIPAAQYLRMSTENQQYSLANQTAAISKYAQQNGFIVVRTYADPGRSGLLIRNRPGLRSLLEDVFRLKTNYRAVLVYDVSRWGRFQDTDEAAHYEFLCRSSGIPVYYCAEQFTNEMTVPNLIAKWLKRVMAAEYSRELSVRVYAALRRAAQQGCRVGSTPGYGFRRLVVSPEGEPKQVLCDGQVKSIRTDQVRLALGPPDEVRVVRLIYRMLLQDGLRPTEIMRELSRRGLTFRGRPWSFYAVKNALTHPKYCGIQVWGRTETKLHTPPKRLPKEQWITSAVRGPHIVDEQTFLKAQRTYLDRTDQKSDEQLLEELRVLWKRNGYLTEFMIDASPLTPTVSTYRRRFGRLSRALRLIGYRQSETRMLAQQRKSRADSLSMRRELIRRLQRMFPGRITPAHYDGCIHCMSEGFDVVVSLCRTQAFLRPQIWSVPPRSEQEHSVNLLCLLNAQNSGFGSFYVFPPFRVRRGFKIRESSSFLSRGARLHCLRDLYRTVTDVHRKLLPSAQRYERDILIGVPQIAAFLHLSDGKVRRLIRCGLPVGHHGRFPTAVPQEIDAYVRDHGTTWKPLRDELGRYVRCATTQVCARNTIS